MKDRSGRDEFDRVGQMMNFDGNELEVQIHRDMEVVERDGLDATFSEAALQAMSLDINAFIGTRIIRYGQQHNVLPQSMTVVVEVTFS
jgi:hypothetical protein